jgi:hypothetical protein
MQRGTHGQAPGRGGCVGDWAVSVEAMGHKAAVAGDDLGDDRNASNRRLSLVRFLMNTSSSSFMALTSENFLCADQQKHTGRAKKYSPVRHDI